MAGCAVCHGLLTMTSSQFTTGCVLTTTRGHELHEGVFCTQLPKLVIPDHTISEGLVIGELRASVQLKLWLPG
eukprot:1164150-Pyramimonas_sp.AAC.1